MSKELEEKIYSMSNSFLPLDMFYNDIRDNKAENYDKERAYKDLEIIANFIIDLQSQLDHVNERLKGLPKFGIGQKVYYVRDTTFPIEIDEIQSRQGNFFYVDYTYNEIFKESELVATREEAQELQNGDFPGE